MDITFEQVSPFLIAAFTILLPLFAKHFITKVEVITEADKEKFEFYKHIYFSAIFDPLNEPIPTEKATDFFIQLCDDLRICEEKSLLLNQYSLNFLNAFSKNPNNDNTILLQNQIHSDFKVLRKKLGYSSSTAKETFLYYSIKIVAFGLTILLILILITLFQLVAEKKSIEWLNVILMIVLCIEFTAIAWLYVIEHHYVVQDNKIQNTDSPMQSVKKYFSKRRHNSES